jgi:8-oxo-dGTP diphosphatase|tara:strand:+ start:1902 stop:2342 length:441 start_codon:yes stop_codon:yes gene_type:complete
MIRRFGQPSLSDKPYVLRAGAYAILPLQKRLLLTAQLGDGVDIQLPGGGIDPGESATQALYREVMEETGWRISAPKRLGAFRRFVFMPEYDLWAEKICHIYVARPTRQICEPLEPNHFTTVMDPNEAALTLGNDGDRHFVEQYFCL